MGANVPSCGNVGPNCASNVCACEGRKSDEVCLWPNGEGDSRRESYPHAAAFALSETGMGMHTLNPVGEAPPEVYQVMQPKRQDHVPQVTRNDRHSEADFDETPSSSLVDYELEGSAVQPEVSQAQVVVKNLVRSLVKGRKVELLATKGGTAECLIFLDRKLTTLSLQRDKGSSKKRAVPLEDVSEIAVGSEAGEEFGLATTDLCIVLILEGGQAIGMAFPDEEERDTFALCLSMFVDGRRNEIKKKQEKAAGFRAA